MTLVTQLIAALVAFVILGILVKRMIEREVPERIGKDIIIVSCVFGVVAMFLSGTVGLMIMGALKARGMSSFGGMPQSFAV